MTPSADARQFAPATERNRDAILAVLQDILPAEGSLLEISSGTGQHAAFFAPHLYPRPWLPSDVNPGAIASITAWRSHCPTDNLYPPVILDVHDAHWPGEAETLPEAWQDLDQAQYPIRAIANINMIHIAPWSACLGLMAGAGRILPADGVLYLYGPYKQQGQHTAPSNAAFDQSLRSQNPAWGVRDLDEVVAAAAVHQLTLQQIYTMPANNLSVVFQKEG